MTLEIVLPERGNDASVKDLVLTILSDGEPKTLTQLHREMKLRGKGATFQAVLKAVGVLVDAGVLTRKDRLHMIDPRWVAECRAYFDTLYNDIAKVPRPRKRVQMGGSVTVYTVGNLLELDRLWNDLLTSWARKGPKDKRNVWRGRHCWWLLPRLQEEDLLHDLFAQQGIKTYNMLSGKTSLDRWAVAYYSRRSERIAQRSPYGQSDAHVAAFGDMLLKFTIPSRLSVKLEALYASTRRLEDIDLKAIMDIFKTQAMIEVTVLHDQMLADALKKEITSQF